MQNLWLVFAYYFACFSADFFSIQNLSGMSSDCHMVEINLPFHIGIVHCYCLNIVLNHINNEEHSK